MVRMAWGMFMRALSYMLSSPAYLCRFFSTCAGRGGRCPGFYGSKVRRLRGDRGPPSLRGEGVVRDTPDLLSFAGQKKRKFFGGTKRHEGRGKPYNWK